MPAEKMQCADCGVEMNHHAEKLDHLAALRDPASVDRDLGGAVQEIHCCPECGKSASRRSA